MYNFAFHRPTGLRQASNMLGKLEEAKILAGGQTLIPTMKLRLASPGNIVDLNAIEGEMAGIELTKAIRARSQGSALPVVIVTSRGSEDDRKRGVEAGADAYMVKRAFDQHALLDTVERLVGR